MAGYGSRSPKVQPVNLTIDRESLAILRQGAATTKGLGHFIGLLAREWRGRMEERARADEAYAEIAQLYGLQPVKAEAVSEK